MNDIRFIDKTGQKFGKLFVLRQATDEDILANNLILYKKSGNRIRKLYYFWCQCDCGSSIKLINTQFLRYKLPCTHSCGCSYRKYPKIQIGEIFGKWTIIGEANKRKTAEYFICRCKCGTEREVISTDLHNLTSTCCGCNNLNINQQEAIQSVLGCVFNNKKSQCNTHNIKFNFSIGEYSLLIQQNCAYSGLVPDHYAPIQPRSSSLTKENGKIKIHTLDRINSSQCYEFGNVVACNFNINCGKNNKEYSDFIDWILNINFNCKKITVNQLNYVNSLIINYDLPINGKRPLSVDGKLLKAIFPLMYKCNKKLANRNYILSKVIKFKYNSSIKNRKSELTDIQIVELILADCVMCGRKVNKEFLFIQQCNDNKILNRLLNGIDRWDNSIGYTVDNSTTLCYYCNSFKMRLSIDRCKEIIIAIKKNLPNLPKTQEEFLEQHSAKNTIKRLIEQVEAGIIIDYFDELPRLKEKLKLL